ncbi:MAG: hypothetical protein FJZ16_02980 [Candidatus Omnitrophica bacterium]|nr:hypothetical protein [Candidatus Omnitrophota bacterium]
MNRIDNAKDVTHYRNRCSNINKKDGLRFVIGNICISVKTKHPGIRKQLERCYKNFISRREPEICIDIEYRDCIKKPNFKSLLFQTRNWELGRENGALSLYFPPRENLSSRARFNAKLNRVKLYTQNFFFDQILLSLFPVPLSLILPKYQSLMLHACGILNNKKGYLFIAQSGGGKSTIAKFADKKGLTVLNDEIIIIHKGKNQFRMFGSPWHGEFPRISNKNCALKEIFFLEKAKDNYLLLLQPKESIIKLMQHTFYLPVNPQARKKVFELCFSMVNNLACYRLGFKPDESIVRFLDEFAK